MSGSNGSRNGSHEESREGRVFKFTHRDSGVSVEITYQKPISGQEYNSVESLVAYVADFLAKLEAAEGATDYERATVITIVNLLLEDPEDIIKTFREHGEYAFLVNLNDHQDESSWTTAQPPANVDVGSN